MKKIFTLLAIAGILFTSCTDDVNETFKPAKVGDEITFGGSVNYDSANKAGQTRVVYGDKVTTGTEIKWYPGDMVRIYCHGGADMVNADGATNCCDYVVDNTIDQTDTNGYLNDKTDDDFFESSSLTRASNEPIGLQWGSEDTHTFYGVYPSPDMFAAGSDINVSLTASQDGTSGTISGHLPSSQAPSKYLAAVDGNYTIHPAMRFAYMAAYGTGKPSDTGVQLQFTPIVTAVEISLTNNLKKSEVEQPLEGISSVAVSAVKDDGTAINLCGDFTTTVTSSGFSTAINANAGQTVSIPLFDENGYPITLAYGKTLTFTVFLLPHQDVNIENLRVSVVANSVTKTATLSTTSNSGIIVEAKKKNFVKNVPLSWNLDTQVSNWMSLLSDDTKVVDVSIPGAGGGWSGNHTTATNGTKTYQITADASREQNLNFTDLWNRGIRCFEIQVNGGGTNSTIICNNVSCGKTLGTALSELQTAIKTSATDTYKNGTEFAVLIVTYNHGGDVDDDRNSGGFQSDLSSLVNSWNNDSNNTSKITSWNSETLVGGENGVRGKILMVARAGSIGIDFGWHGLGTYNSNIVYCLGWGFLPDQWYARGFGKVQPWYDGEYGTVDSYTQATVEKSTAARPFVAATTAPDGSTYGYTYVPMSDNSAGYYTNGKEGSELHKISSDFGYIVPSGTGTYNITTTTPTAWAQEWKRICETDATFTTTPWNSYKYWWKGTLQEKKDDIEETLNMSMNRGTAMYGDNNNYTYYINSLCGYYITSSEKLSYYPALNVQRYNGGEGDVHPDGKYQGNVGYRTTGGITGWFGINFSVGDNSGTWGTWNENSDNAWGPYYPTGGYAGDIAGFAEDINPWFYNLLKDKITSNSTGTTGIVLVDRVAETTDDAAGYYIPQIIINNNFATAASASNYSLRKSNYDDGDILAAPAQRGVKGADEGVSIVWE